MAIFVTPLTPFDPHGDAGSVSQKWQKWLRSFECFAAAAGCKDDRQKRQLLLHSAGPEVQDIFDTLANTGDVYATAHESLTAYFRPQVNIPYNRHVFRQERQKPDETVAQFVTRLRQLAVTCDFGASADDFIRDQVIDKCISKHLRTKLLAEKDLQLARLLELAQAKEASELHSSHFEEREKAFAVHRNQYKPPQRFKSRDSNNTDTKSKGECSRCGLRGHTGDECRCSKNVTCHRCNKKGHFKSVCKAKLPHKETGRPKVTVKCIRESIGSDSDSASSSSFTDEYAFAVDTDSGTLTVTVEDEPVDMLIDSGATCNIINGVIASKLKARGARVGHCRRVIHPYGSQPINIRRYVTADIRVAGGEPVEADFLVMSGTSVPLLRKVTAESLGVLRVGVRVNHVRDHIPESKVLQKYPGLCKGIGCLRDFKVTLHIDRSVTPVARKHSRVPIHLRSKVEGEIERLLDEDIIERVSGPTEWVSRIVTPPKPKNPGEIRICVDMRDANKAIQRTRHITPITDELITELNGSRVYSKIDLRSAYHQLELEPSCRYITTFSTHMGLFRYKRLSFGVNSAAEIFQYTVQTILQGIPGACNISDDILVYGKTNEEHDLAVSRTLDRLHRSGLTVNPKKCEFGKDRVTFFGYVFSAAGMSPDPLKVKSLQDAAEPQNASEVRSLLGMAQYSARFIDNFADITEPLRKLTRQDMVWHWDKPQQDAFQKLRTSGTATGHSYLPRGCGDRPRWHPRERP